MIKLLKEIKGPRGKWKLAFQLAPIIVFIVALKWIFHYYNFEFFTFNPLFTSIIAATVFLVGFLISGVLSDYKESEKLPGEIALSLEAMLDEALSAYQNKKISEGKDFAKFIETLYDDIYSWLYGKTTYQEVMIKIDKINDYCFALEKGQVAPAFIGRIKSEQQNLRRSLSRIHNIKETDFVATAYAITEALAIMIITGLLFAKVEPFYEALFFVALVSFLVTYMLFLIRDIEDPFEYDDKGESAGEVSLLLMHEFEERLKAKLKF